MNKASLVSIVMPACEAAEYISQSIVSVQQQTYSNWELLVIDDASLDATSEITTKFMKDDNRIRLHRLPANQGAGFARNIGIKASEGDFIAFLDADDVWYPWKLESQLDFMQKNEVGVCYSSYELMDEQGISLNRMIKALDTLTFEKLLKANYVGNLTGIYNSGKLGKIYCPLIRKRQDWALWLLAIKKAGGARGIEQPLAAYRVRKNSISGNKLEMLQYNYKVYKEVLGFSALKSSLWLLRFLLEQFFVKSKQNVPLKEGFKLP